MSSAYPSHGPVCQRCGKPLRQNEVQCSNCGFFIAQPQIYNPTNQPPKGATWGNGAPPSPFGSAPFGGQQSNQLPFQGQAQPAPHSLFNEHSVPQVPFGTPSPSFGTQAQVQPQSPSSPASFVPLSGNFAQSSFQQPSSGFLPTAAQTFNGGFQGNYQPANMNGFSSGSLPKNQKQEKRTWLMIGMIALVVILIAVSLGGYFVFSKSGNTALEPKPSYTPAPLPTGKPLFSDQFTNNNNGWDLTSCSGQFSVKVGNGSMTLEDDNNRLLWEIVPGGRVFSNFYLTVDAVLSKGSQDNGYGIYIRGASNQSLDIATYYRFEIYGDGSYAIFKGTQNASGTLNVVKLVDYTISPAIHTQGQVNQIAINANGPGLSFYVNGQLIKFVTDNTYTNGSIAMFVSNLPNSPPGVQATFSHFVIYPAQP
jgi:predicted nucleic acid-binding Zn ribbon protein